MDEYIIALAPLLLAIAGLAIALPVGLHYADKDRTERAMRAGTAPFRPIHVSASAVGYYVPSRFAGLLTIADVGVVGLGPGTEVVQPQSKQSEGSTQPPIKLAAAA